MISRPHGQPLEWSGVSIGLLESGVPFGDLYTSFVSADYYGPGLAANDTGLSGFDVETVRYIMNTMLDIKTRFVLYPDYLARARSPPAAATT